MLSVFKYLFKMYKGNPGFLSSIISGCNVESSIYFVVYFYIYMTFTYSNHELQRYPNDSLY